MATHHFCAECHKELGRAHDAPEDSNLTAGRGRGALVGGAASSSRRSSVDDGDVTPSTNGHLSNGLPSYVSDVSDLSFVVIDDSDSMAMDGLTEPKGEPSSTPTPTSASAAHSTDAHNAESMGMLDERLAQHARTSSLRNVLSRSTSDTPPRMVMCEHCIDTMVDLLQEDIHNLSQERDSYQHALRQLEAEVAAPPPQSLAKVERELAAMTKGAAERREESLTLESEMVRLHELGRQQADEERAIWESLRGVERATSEFNDELNVHLAECYGLSHVTESIEWRGPPLADLFQVAIDNDHVTINGLILERWKVGATRERNEETAAAWGAAAMLVSAAHNGAMARGLGRNGGGGGGGGGFEVLPLSCAARVVEVDTGAVHELAALPHPAQGATERWCIRETNRLDQAIMAFAKGLVELLQRLTDGGESCAEEQNLVALLRTLQSLESAEPQIARADSRDFERDVTWMRLEHGIGHALRFAVQAPWDVK